MPLTTRDDNCSSYSYLDSTSLFKESVTSEGGESTISRNESFMSSRFNMFLSIATIDDLASPIFLHRRRSLIVFALS